MSLSGWNENNKIILNIDNTKVDEDLTDFPVLITLSSGTGQNTYDATDVFDELSYDDRKNIAITDSNDNQLYTEIEYWNNYTDDLTNISFTHYSNNTLGNKLNMSDNSLTTYVQNYTYCAIDFGAAGKVIEKFRVAVHNSLARTNLLGQKFQGSNNSTNGNDGSWNDLITFTSDNFGTPSVYPGFGNWITISGSSYKMYRLTGLANNNTVTNEWEMLEVGNPRANLWVKVPSISSVSGTVLYLYYDATVSGNTGYVGDTGDLPAQEVWDSDYRIVQHLADANLVDSTYNSNDGIDSGTADITGQIGRGRDFELSESDYVSFGDVEDVNGTSFTASIIYKFESLTGLHRLCQKRGTGLAGSYAGWQLSTLPTADYWGNTYFDNGAGQFLQVGASANSGVEIDVFHQADLVFNTAIGNAKIYIDGLQVDSQTNANLIGANLTNARHFTLGCAWDAAGTQSQFFDGVLDEFRFSDSARSAAWIKATYYSNFDDFITFADYVPPVPPPPPTISGVANIWATDNFVFKTMVSGIGVYDVSSEALLGLVSYTPGYAGAVWANDNYLYISTIDSGVIRSPMSSISGAVYNNLSVYKNYPDISSEWVNYIHGAGNYLNVATISGAHIFDLTTGSGVYSNTSISAQKCHQLADRTSYYIYDDKALTIYNDDLYYMYQSGDGIIPTISGMNDLYVVPGTNNLILLATTGGAVVIEERKGDEENSRFKYYYIEE